MGDNIIKKIKTTSGNLPVEPIQASTTQLGGVKIDGSTITINENGVISSSGGGSSNPTKIVNVNLLSEAVIAKSSSTNIDISQYLTDGDGTYQINFSLYGRLNEYPSSTSEYGYAVLNFNTDKLTTQRIASFRDFSRSMHGLYLVPTLLTYTSNGQINLSHYEGNVDFRVLKLTIISVQKIETQE